MRRPLFLLILLTAAGCGRAPQEIVLSGPTMGTTYTVKVAAPPAGVGREDVAKTISAVLERIDLGMSGYRDDSEIARFNASATTDWFAVSADVAQVVQIALEVSERSDGAFDATVAPLVNAWGFGPGEGAPSAPDGARLQEIREHVGYQKLHVRLEPAALRKDDPQLDVDLNGVAPGYAVDLLAARLQAMRIENFMIDIGGEVRARGHNGRGEVWRIAVERPVDTTPPAPYAIVQLEDMAITTSGEYRHYYERNGRRYSHTIDPRTAHPVAHTLASVVVIGSSAAYADAWATAYNVLGTQAGYELAAELDMPVMFIEWRGAQLAHRATPQFAANLAAD